MSIARARGEIAVTRPGAATDRSMLILQYATATVAALAAAVMAFVR